MSSQLQDDYFSLGSLHPCFHFIHKDAASPDPTSLLPCPHFSSFFLMLLIYFPKIFVFLLSMPSLSQFLHCSPCMCFLVHVSLLSLKVTCSVMRKIMMTLVLFFQFFILWRGWYWTWKWKDSKKYFAKIIYLIKRGGKSFHLTRKDEKISRFLEAVNSVLSAIHFSSWIAELWQVLGIDGNDAERGQCRWRRSFSQAPSANWSNWRLGCF